MDLKHSDITEKSMGAAFRGHKTLGNGFDEVISGKALELESKKMDLPHARKFEMQVFYLNQLVHYALAINYPEAYTPQPGFLINFESRQMEFHRFANKQYKSINH